jgi:hypothetical protein
MSRLFEIGNFLLVLKHVTSSMLVKIKVRLDILHLPDLYKVLVCVTLTTVLGEACTLFSKP